MKENELSRSEKKEWEKMAQIAPDGVRIIITPDPVRRNEIAAVCRSWDEWLKVNVLIVYFQSAHRQMKKEGKNPTIDKILKEARREYRKMQMAKPPSERSEILWE